MQFDLSIVETATMVFFGTIVVALIMSLFLALAAFAALVLVGVGRLAWIATASTVLGLARHTTQLWSSLVRHASAVELPGDLQGGFRSGFHGHAVSSGTGTYPQVALRDS